MSSLEPQREYWQKEVLAHKGQFVALLNALIVSGSLFPWTCDTVQKWNF